MCPNCHHPVSKVILTRTVDEVVKVRRRRCARCEHRWYTYQDGEKVLPDGAVQWVGRRMKDDPQKIKLTEAV